MKTIQERVAELIERYKDPTQLNGTDYLFIPVDKIRQTLTDIESECVKEKEEIMSNIKTVFSVYFATFPTPRSPDHREAQEVIKQSVRNLEKNLLELLAKKHNIQL